MQRLEEHFAVGVQHAIQLRVFEFSADVHQRKRALLNGGLHVSHERTRLQQVDVVAQQERAVSVINRETTRKP